MNARPSVRIRAQLPNLLPTEQRVAGIVLENMTWAVDATANQLAERAKVGRTTVIRTAQALGYEGYQQLRVAVTQELAATPPKQTAPSEGLLQTIQGRVDAFAQQLTHLTSLLDEDSVKETIAAVITANRVLVVGNGLSAALAQDFAGRLSGHGRPAEFVADAVSETITARQLGKDSVCVVISGSGANRLSLDSARAASQSDAKVIGITSFVGSALDRVADISLFIPTEDDSFREELEHSSRVTYQLILEILIELIVPELKAQATDARSAVYTVIGQALEG